MRWRFSSLASKGGEGIGPAVSEHRDVCIVQHPWAQQRPNLRSPANSPHAPGCLLGYGAVSNTTQEGILQQPNILAVLSRGPTTNGVFGANWPEIEVVFSGRFSYYFCA